MSGSNVYSFNNTLKFSQRVIPTAVSTIEIPNLTVGLHKFHINNIKVSALSNLFVQISSDNGATWKTTNYSWGGRITDTSGAADQFATGAGSPANGFLICDDIAANSFANGTFDLVINNDFTFIVDSNLIYTKSAEPTFSCLSGSSGSATATLPTNRIRLIVDSGTFTNAQGAVYHSKYTPS